VSKAKSGSLITLDRAHRALADAKSIDEVKSIRDQAEAVRKYVAAARLGLTKQNRAAEIKLRAERKAGRMLERMRLRGGNRKSKLHDVTLKLESLGITRIQSSRWQLEAQVPEEAFVGFVREADANGYELTSAALIRLARRQKGGNGANGAAKPAKAPSSGAAVLPLATDPEVESKAKSIVDAVSELENHRQLIEEIITRLCDNQLVTYKPADRRALKHFLSEMRVLLAGIRATLEGRGGDQ
jgi:hypothetical protein